MTKQSILITLTGEDLTDIVRRVVSDCLTEAKESEGQNVPKDEYLSPLEAAKLLKVDRRTIHTRVRDGLLTRYKVGRCTRYRKDEVLSLLEPVERPMA
jgi:excisionase family DNA binding protein